MRCIASQSVNAYTEKYFIDTRLVGYTYQSGSI